MVALPGFDKEFLSVIKLRMGLLVVLASLIVSPGLGKGVRIQHFVTIAPHGGFVANGCCYAGGTEYEINTYFGSPTNSASVKFVPRSCSVDGILYGFAAFAFQDYKLPQDSPSTYRVAGGRIDEKCPWHYSPGAPKT